MILVNAWTFSAPAPAPTIFTFFFSSWNRIYFHFMLIASTMLWFWVVCCHWMLVLVKQFLPPIMLYNNAKVGTFCFISTTLLHVAVDIFDASRCRLDMERCWWWNLWCQNNNNSLFQRLCFGIDSDSPITSRMCVAVFCGWFIKWPQAHISCLVIMVLVSHENQNIRNLFTHRNCMVVVCGLLFFFSSGPNTFQFDRFKWPT